MLVIDFFGGFLASPAGRSRNHSVPESDASASVWASGASAWRIAGAAPDAAHACTSTFGASRPRIVPPFDPVS